MADRTSAALFADLFEDLAKEPTPDLEQAKKLWKRSQGYDFHPCQMSCDKALIKLDLCKRHGAGEDLEIRYRNGDATGWEEP